MKDGQEYEDTPFFTYFTMQKVFLSQQKGLFTDTLDIFYSVDEGVELLVRTHEPTFYDELNDFVYSHSFYPDRKEEFDSRMEELENKYGVVISQKIKDLSYEFYDLRDEAFFLSVTLSDETDATCDECAGYHPGRFIGKYFPPFRLYPASVEAHHYYGCAEMICQESPADNMEFMHKITKIINSAYDTATDEDSKKEIRLFRKKLVTELCKPNGGHYEF